MQPGQAYRATAGHPTPDVLLHALANKPVKAASVDAREPHILPWPLSTINYAQPHVETQVARQPALKFRARDDGLVIVDTGRASYLRVAKSLGAVCGLHTPDDHVSERT